MNLFGHFALIVCACDFAAQDRAAQMIAAILLVMMASVSPGSPDVIWAASSSAGFSGDTGLRPRRRSCIRVPSTTPEGDAIFVCLLGVPDGRWSEALNRDRHSCKALQSLVKKAFLSAGLQDAFSVTCAMSSTSASGPTVIGIARMIRWSIVTISTTSGHAALGSAMKAALRLKRSRSKGIQFLYHRFLEVANWTPQSRSRPYVPPGHRPQTWQTQ